MMDIMRAPAAEYLIRQRVSALGRALPAAKAGDVTSLHRRGQDTGAPGKGRTAYGATSR